MQAPQAYIDHFNATISDPHRRTLAGMIRSLDEGVANVTAALRAAGIFEDTLILFSADNGGPADLFNEHMASNWPLRGTKRTLFEGGVRGTGFISGAGLGPSRQGAVLTGKVHVTDFMPSVLTMAARATLGWGNESDWRTVVARTAQHRGGSVVDPPFVLGDGMDLWDYLSGANASSPRAEVLHEAHSYGSTDGNGNALRVGDYKIVLRTGSNWATGTRLGSNDGWYGGYNSSDPVTDG